MFEAQIQAGKLKHAASVLRRVNDEAMFEITDDMLMCRLTDSGNVAMAHITLPRAAFDFYAADDMRIGVDLDRLAGKILKKATAKDVISMSGDAEVWQFTRGIHQKTMSLLDPEKLRRAISVLDLSHAAEVRLPGKTFKDIVAEAADYSDHVLIHATSDVMTIEAESKDMKSERYECTLPADQYYEMFERDTSCLYTLEYLQDIAVDMKAKDNVLFKFATGMPCEISYERDDVAVRFILAPRIESD